MKEVIAGISLDNGGSEVRVLADNADMSDIITMSNDFVSIAESDFRIKDVEDPKALCVFRKAPKKEYLGIIARGLTGKAYTNTSLMITSQESKTGSLNYYRQFLFAVARNAIEVFLKENTPTVKTTGFFRKREEVTYEDIHIKYAIVTCIPIKEHSGNKDCASILKNNIAGEYEVEFPLLPNKPVVKFGIDPTYVGVVPEGGVAIAGLKGRVRPEDITLVVDMGHVSTDIALFQGTALYGRVSSSAYAGSMLVGEVRAAMEEEGYRLTDAQAMEVLSTNAVWRGANHVNVKEIVDACRVAFVKNYLMREIIQNLNMNAINVKQVQNFLPIGRPLRDKGKGSVRQAIIDSCGLEDAVVEELPVDTRYANIKMTSIYTKKMVQALRESQAAEE